MAKTEIITTQNVSLDTANSGIGKRFLAWLIDFIVVIGIIILFNLILVEANIVENNMYAIFSSIIFFFYNYVFELFMNGKSPGKAALKIRVVKITGESATGMQYFIRALFRPIDMIMGLGLILMIFNHRNQRLGDLVAGTFVIKTNENYKIEDTIMADIEENYTPLLTRSQIEKLTPENMELMKRVYEEAIRTREYSHFLKMHHKVLEITGAKPEGLPLEFIKRVIKDYTYYA